MVAVGSAQALSQVLSICTLPVLSRYFSPTAFGTYTLFLGVCAVAAVFAGLRYETAIVLPRSRRTATALSILVLTIGVLAAALVLLTAVLGLVFPGLSMVAAIGVPAAASVCVGTVQRIAVAWLNRQQEYAWFGLVQFSGVLATLVSQFVLLAHGIAEEQALVWGSVAGQIGATMLGAVVLLARPQPQPAPPLTASIPRIVAAAVAYRRFPKYMLMYGLSSTLRDRVVQFTLGAFCGTDVLGKFAMATRIMGAPNSLIYAAANPVLLSYASRVPRDQVAENGARLVEALALFLAPIFIFFCFNAAVLMHLILGAKWGGVEHYAVLLAAPYFAWSVTAWLDRLFDVYNKQLAALQIDIVYTMALCSVVYALANPRSPIVAVAGFAVVFVTYEVVWTFLAYRVTGLETRQLRRPLYAVLLSVPIFLILGYATSSLAGLLERTIAFFICQVVIVAAYLRFFGGATTIKELFARPGIAEKGVRALQ
jgi:O-antigen/teichoic acid export membrane protein